VRAIDIEHLAGVTRLQARDTNRLIEIWNTFEPPDQLYQGKPVNEFEKSDRPYQGKPVKVESRQLAFFLSEAEAPETIHLEQPHDRRI